MSFSIDCAAEICTFGACCLQLFSHQFVSLQAYVTNLLVLKAGGIAQKVVQISRNVTNQVSGRSVIYACTPTNR